jgi:hypothetical protein
VGIEAEPHERLSIGAKQQDGSRSRSLLASWLPVAGVVLLSLALNLWGIRHGLPYIYSPDERGHFVAKAFGFFASGTFDPGYYVNPAAFTYLLYGVFWLWFGGGEKVLAADPADLILVGRVTTAILGTSVVFLVYLTGRRLFGHLPGLAAATLLAVAFLPVYWAKVAVNDVPAMLPVVLALFGAVGIARDGRRLDYLLAGMGVGLAVGTKYTAGIVAVAVLTSAAIDVYRRRAAAVGAVALGIVVSLAAFVVVNPYSVLNAREYFGELGIFSLAPRGEGKAGQTADNGLLHYSWVLLWGFGWLPLLTAAAGGVLLAWERRLAALLLIPAPLLYVVFMGVRTAFFGRYMLPIFPFLALLAGYGLFRLAVLLGRRRPALTPAILALALAAGSAQSLVHVLHADAVLTRTSTREQTVDWMVENVPAADRVAVEPIYLAPTTLRGVRGDQAQALPWPLFQWPSTAGQSHIESLTPQVLDVLEREGFCWVVTQRSRAFAEPETVPRAIAFYHALGDRADLVFTAIPFKPGRDPVPFDYDWSSNYYPLAFERPGPTIEVYRLRRPSCAGTL